MALLIGTLLALAVGIFARYSGLDRDRAFYPTVMIVIACLYSLFAILGASTTTLVIEMLIGAVFIVGAVAGFKSSLWIVVAALAVHGVLDVVHGMIISNPGVPGWYPEFCFTYDVVAAAYLAWLLKSKRVRAAA